MPRVWWDVVEREALRDLRRRHRALHVLFVGQNKKRCILQVLKQENKGYYYWFLYRFIFSWNVFHWKPLKCPRVNFREQRTATSAENLDTCQHADSHSLNWNFLMVSHHGFVYLWGNSLRHHMNSWLGQFHWITKCIYVMKINPAESTFTQVQYLSTILMYLYFTLILLLLYNSEGNITIYSTAFI